MALDAASHQVQIKIKTETFTEIFLDMTKTNKKQMWKEINFLICKFN